MPKTIKPNLRTIRENLEKALNQTWDLIHALDLDPVSGESPKRNTALDIHLNSLIQELDEAKKTLNKVIDYQPDSGITFQPRKKR